MKHKTHHPVSARQSRDGLYNLFYPRGWIIIALFLFGCAVLAQEQTPAEEFHIGTSVGPSLVTNPNMFTAFESTGLNTIYQRADITTEFLLANYNLLAWNADTLEYIHHYSTGYYSKWQAETNAESDRVGMKHRDTLGYNIGDTATWKGRLCWSTIGLSTARDSLMYGPHYRQDKRYKRWLYGCYNQPGCLTYTPRFNMALHNPSTVDTSEDVCLIKVVLRYKDKNTGKHHDTTFIERTLKVGDFDTTGNFDNYYLNSEPLFGRYEYPSDFGLPKNIGQMVDSPTLLEYIDWEAYTGIQFCVDWLRTDTLCTLYIDYVEVYDNDGWNEYIDDKTVVSLKIKNYAQNFSDWDNIMFWGGQDEPYSIDAYTPIHIVDSLLADVSAPRMINTFNPSWWHTLKVNGEDEVNMFYNIAKPSKINLAINPCSEDWPVIRYGDFEWMRFNFQRTSALDSNFWFVAQTHGLRRGNPPTNDWCVWRKPEPPELKAMVMLSLAHGAKGVTFMWFDSFAQELQQPSCTGWNYWEAIVDEDGIPIPDSSYSLYYTIKDNLVPR